MLKDQVCVFSGHYTDEVLKSNHNLRMLETFREKQIILKIVNMHIKTGSLNCIDLITWCLHKHSISWVLNNNALSRHFRWVPMILFLEMHHHHYHHHHHQGTHYMLSYCIFDSGQPRHNYAQNNANSPRKGRHWYGSPVAEIRIAHTCVVRCTWLASTHCFLLAVTFYILQRT